MSRATRSTTPITMSRPITLSTFRLVVPALPVSSCEFVLVRDSLRHMDRAVRVGPRLRHMQALAGSAHLTGDLIAVAALLPPVVLEHFQLAVLAQLLRAHIRRRRTPTCCLRTALHSERSADETTDSPRAQHVSARRSSPEARRLCGP